MATPDPSDTSHRLSQAALAERKRLIRRLDRLDERATTLRQQLDELTAERDDAAKRLSLLNELLPTEARHLDLVAPPPEREPPHGYLRGATIRRVAVQLFADSPRPTAPIHYKQWLELVQGAGYGVAGRDPLATFLTQINRSSIVQRADAPGTYVLDLDAPERLRAQLSQLHDELLRLHHGQQTLEAIVSTRTRRDDLVAEITRTERALEDALMTLATGPEYAE